MRNEKPLLPMLLMLLLAALGGCATTAPPAEMATHDGQAHPPAPVAEAKAAPKEPDTQDHPAAKGGDAGKTGSAQDAKLQREYLYPGSGVFHKAPPAAAPADGGPQDVSMNFEGADLREVIRILLGDILHENYVIDPRVQGTVTVHTSQPISRAAALPTLESLLRMNGAALLKEDGVYKVLPLAGALRGSATPRVDGVGQPGYGVQIVPLQYMGVREMVKILEPLLPEGSIVRVDETRNLLMLAGGERELRHALETISIFDVDWLSGMSVGLFTLHNVEVKDILKELQTLFGETAKGPFAGLVRIIPIERMNAIFVATPQPKYLEQARIWVERLDKSGGAGGGTRLFVYPVQNGKAEKMAALLNDIFGGRSQAAATPPTLAPGLAPAEIKTAVPGAPAAPPVAAAAGTGGQGLAVSGGGTVRGIADKDNNALLILASPGQYESIENAIRKLDIVPRQVLIEVTIAEVTLTGVLSYGLDWYFNNATNIVGGLNINGLPTPPSNLPALPQGQFTAAWLGPTGDVKAVLHALATKDLLNVISSPHVMVADNQTAKIQVGDQVPTTSQSQSIAGSAVGIINSIQYLDTGVLLSVTPHVNAGGLVTMDVSQEVSLPSKTTTSGIDSPTISKRTVKSVVAVQSGETMVMGGLITDSKTAGSSGLPFLSDIPVAGALFGSKTQNDKRTELLVLITPRVVNNSQEARDVTAEFRSKLSRVKFGLVKKVGPATENEENPK